MRQRFCEMVSGCKLTAVWELSKFSKSRIYTLPQLKKLPQLSSTLLALPSSLERRRSDSGENEIYAPGVNGGVGHAERHGRELILGNHLTAHFLDQQHPFSTIAVPAGKNHTDRPLFESGRH